MSNYSYQYRKKLNKDIIISQNDITSYSNNDNITIIDDNYEKLTIMTKDKLSGSIKSVKSDGNILFKYNPNQLNIDLKDNGITVLDFTTNNKEILCCNNSKSNNTNIYNSNGNLLENRLVNGNNNNLTFSNLSNLNLSGRIYLLDIPPTINTNNLLLSLNSSTNSIDIKEETSIEKQSAFFLTEDEYQLNSSGQNTQWDLEIFNNSGITRINSNTEFLLPDNTTWQVTVKISCRPVNIQQIVSFWLSYNPSDIIRDATSIQLEGGEVGFVYLQAIYENITGGTVFVYIQDITDTIDISSGINFSTILFNRIK